MPHGKLAEIVLDFIVLELADDERLDPDTAVGQHESVAAHLGEATPEERAATDHARGSPRVGHLHVRVDDLPWLWADTSDNNTVDIGGMPPGEHKVTIELVDPTHQVYPGQSKTVKFTVPKSTSHAH